MRKLYASEDRFLFQSVRSELDVRDIPYLVKNEFASGAIGELPWQDSQQEIWIVDDNWFPRAQAVVDAMPEPLASTQSADPWQCPQCGEVNGGAFEVCWQCEQPRKDGEMDQGRCE
ncbi:DUF2007 domain-containing protein [Alteromonas sp. H39]|uniref:putative signal transducing protein n=1 Tax=Alteromonas sp. H39 TaxID=3389876 RepID=UPI0039E0DCB4